MRALPLERMTRAEVAAALGVSERTVVRDEAEIGRSCRVLSRTEISELGVQARQQRRRLPTREQREVETARLMNRWLRRSIVGVAA